MIYKIANYSLQLDWGAFILAASVTGKSPVAPLLDVPTEDAYAAILYAGVNRHAESMNQASTMSFDEAKEAMKSFHPMHVGKLDAAWLEVTTVDPDERFPVAADAKKKR